MIKEGNNSFLTIGSTLPVNVNISGTRKSIFSQEVIKVRLIYVVYKCLCVRDYTLCCKMGLLI